RLDLAPCLAGARTRHSDGARRARCDAADSRRRPGRGRRRRRRGARAGLMAKKPARPRVFVTQPVSEHALARLRAVARVKIFPDASWIIPKRTLIDAVRKAPEHFCLLVKPIDRAIVTANP